MALVHRHTHVTEWPTFGWPERRKQPFEVDEGRGRLGMEEFHDGDVPVVRAELPDIRTRM
jgi:hypothetical protein